MTGKCIILLLAIVLLFGIVHAEYTIAFSDEFSSLNTSVWDTYTSGGDDSHPPSVSGGELLLYNSAGVSRVQTKEKYITTPEHFKVDIYTRIESVSTATGLRLGGVDYSKSTDDGAGDCSQGQYRSDNLYRVILFNEGSGGYIVPTSNSTYTFDTNMFKYTYEAKDGYGYIYINDVLIGYATNAYSPDEDLYLRMRAYVAMDTSTYHYIDNVTLYNWVDKSASFVASPTSGNEPLKVTFQDTSTGFPEEYPYPAYQISFGDGYFASGDRQYTGEYWFHEYTAGNYTVYYNVTYDGTTYSDSETITVSETSANYEVTVHGLNTAPIEGANVSIWYDGSYQDSEGTSSQGIAYFEIEPYRWVYGTVTMPGYYNATFDTYIYPEDNFESVTLYTLNETPGSGSEYGNLITTFRNADDNSIITYVPISVYSDSNYSSLFFEDTALSGVWTALMPMNITYYYDVDMYGYLPIQWEYNLTANPSYLTKYLSPIEVGGYYNIKCHAIDTSGNDVSMAVIKWYYDSTLIETVKCNTSGWGTALLPKVARTYDVTGTAGFYNDIDVDIYVENSGTLEFIFTRSASTTPTPTTHYTPVVTPAWSGDYGQPGNAKEALINFFMTMLGFDAIGAGMLIGLCITGAAAIGVGKFVGSVGAMIGAIIAFTACCVIGFFPIWLLAFSVILVFAAWFFFKDSGGE